jgi:hypothetical protein
MKGTGMMRTAPLLFAALALALPLPAAAQSVDWLLISDNDLIFNDADCGSDEPVLIEYDATPGETGSSLAIVVHEENVGSGENPPCPGWLQPGVRIGDYITLPSAGLFQIDQLSFTTEDLIGDERCNEAPARNTTAMLCFYILDRAQQQAASYGERLEFDTLVPAAPEIVSVVEGDGTFSFAIAADDAKQGESYSYYYQYRACSDVSAADAGSATDAGLTVISRDGGVIDEGATVVIAASTCDAPGDFLEKKASSPDQVTLSGLTNEVQYEVRVRVVDDHGNESQPSAASLITPQKELSPLDQYTGYGSPFSFTPPNCADGFGGMIVPLFLALVLGLASALRRRRPRPALAALGVALLPALLLADGARADTGSVTLDLRVGPYKPAIDTEVVDGEPIFPVYSCFFDDATLPEVGLTLDMHLFDDLGSLQVGTGLSVSQARGKTRDLATASEVVTGECDKSADATGDIELTMVKIRPGLTYRFDPLLDWWGVPLVPYARLGVVANGYAWTRAGAFDDGQRVQPAGFVFGYEGSAGLMLALDFWDWVDPFTKHTTIRARALDVFNHAFIFAEAQYQRIDNFGSAGYVFSPVDPTGATDLPWTFHFGLAVEFL